ncbi:MAG: hypothetical protein ACTH5B_14435 [Marinomonas sp.]|uniref:hypothetical protein n=1 Tax=Marinomonas sp. TaxID=1904862 RepID=UPI003F9CE8DE
MARLMASARNCSIEKSGYLVALGGVNFIFSLIDALSFLLIISAVCYWLFFFLSWRTLNSRNIKQISALLLVSLIALFCAFIQSTKPILWSKLLEGNIGIISLLVGVSLLSLLPNDTHEDSQLKGKRGLLSIWGSVHLLGAVINMSSPFLLGDKLQRHGKLNPTQLSVLVRALTSAGFWSPFFASMAVALSIAPNAEYHYIILVGIPIAIVACLISLYEFKHQNQLDNFIGLPLATSTLKLPIFLALMVLFFHYYITPNLIILAIVTLMSPLCVISLLMYQKGLNATAITLQSHTVKRFPKMANEISLFLAAGLMTSSISLLVSSTFGEQWSLFESFGFWESILCYFAICLTALLGLHPIVGISIMSSMVPYTEANNTLLAFVSISAWGVGTAISPLSGVNLSIGGKYEVDNYQLARANLKYGATLSTIVVIAFYVLSLLGP